MTEARPETFYDAVGGEPTFTKLVREFYSGVRGDPLLRFQLELASPPGIEPDSPPERDPDD